jgi:GNAT superfamily N-acetyltransferase
MKFHRSSIKTNSYLNVLFSLKHNNKTIAYVNFLKYKTKINILYLFVESKYRRQGHATYLLNRVINYGKIYKISKIKLDNMTKPNNKLYLLNGFKYKYEMGPEMVYKLNFH